MTTLPQVFVGVDVAKDHLDIHVHPLGKAFRIKNAAKDIKKLTLYKNPGELPDLKGLDPDCSICSKNLLAKMKPVMEVGCKDEPHRFHAKCFKSWFSTTKTCPKCHAEIVTEEDEPKESKGIFRQLIYKLFCCKKCTCCK